MHHHGHTLNQTQEKQLPKSQHRVHLSRPCHCLTLIGSPLCHPDDHLTNIHNQFTHFLKYTLPEFHLLGPNNFLISIPIMPTYSVINQTYLLIQEYPSLSNSIQYGAVTASFSARLAVFIRHSEPRFGRSLTGSHTSYISEPLSKRIQLSLPFIVT